MLKKKSINDESSCCVNKDTKMESEELAFPFIKAFGFCVPIFQERLKVFC